MAKTSGLKTNFETGITQRRKVIETSQSLLQVQCHKFESCF
ncbi:MAG: hypothetical protein WCJ11_10885 [Methylococcaceae bacterium]